MAGNVLVFVEQRSGTIHPASRQMFTAARELAGDSGAEVHAVIAGEGIAGLAEDVARYGVACIHLADDPELSRYRAMPYRAVLGAAIRQAGADIVLMATTFMTRDLAPRVAARLGGALATDCLEVGMNDGTLHVKRPMYCAKCIAELAMADDRVRLLSIRPNAYAAPAGSTDAGAAPRTMPLVPGLTEEDTRVTVVDVVRAGGATKDVAEADVIVSGGRSLKSEESFRIIEDLAEALDGAVGASRAAVDAGYQPASRQVGLTGKVVTPRLYIACGIDGAVQHLAGMRGSRVIVAVNTKAEAPIFDVATYGCVADLFTLVPLLTAELRQAAEVAVR
jgi:electron transfer flavoprotein alpha subunit